MKSSTHRLEEGHMARYIKSSIREDRIIEFLRYCIRKKTTLNKRMQLRMNWKYLKNLYYSWIYQFTKQDHPNIIRIYEYFQTNQFTAFVMEYCKGGNLLQGLSTLKQINESLMMSIMHQLFSAVCYSHNLNIVHRDIKPDNILFSDHKIDSPIKLIDFGIATQLNANQKLYERRGTLHFMAPEQFLGDKGYDKKCDIWACGVIMYLIITGKKPFEGRDEKTLQYLIENNEVDFDQGNIKLLSQECQDFLKWILIKNPNQRPNAQQSLKHVWLKNYRKSQELDKDQIRLAVENFRKFQQQQDVEKVLQTFFVSNLISDQEREKMYLVFKKLDTDGNGQLSKQELYKGLCSIMKGKDAIKEVEGILKFCDIDGNGQIDFSEFISVCIDRKLLLDEQRLMHLFNILDSDNNHVLSYDEVFQLFQGLQYSFAWFKCSNFIQQFDMNQDGQLDFQEFKRMMFTILG